MYTKTDKLIFSSFNLNYLMLEICVKFLSVDGKEKNCWHLNKNYSAGKEWDFFTKYELDEG